MEKRTFSPYTREGWTPDVVAAGQTSLWVEKIHEENRAMVVSLTDRSVLDPLKDRDKREGGYLRAEVPLRIAVYIVKEKSPMYRSDGWPILKACLLGRGGESIGELKKPVILAHPKPYGIADYEDGAKGLIRALKEKKQNGESPAWIRHDPDAYVRHGSVWLDDCCTKGVFHPTTPIEVIKFITENDPTPEQLNGFLVAVLQGEVELSGKAYGQSPENTCPECGGYMASGATRSRIYYSCTKCSYYSAEDNLTDPCPR